LFLFRLSDPLAVFLAIREAERVEEIADIVLLHQAGKVGGDVDGAFAFIAPGLNGDPVSELFASLFADGFEYADHVLLAAARDQGSEIGDAFEGDFDRDSAFYSKLLSTS